VECRAGNLFSERLKRVLVRRKELVIFAAPTRAREAGRRDAARPARSAWSVQRPLAARFDGEVAGGAVADSFFVIFRFGATMELGRSGRSMMMMTSASASGGDGGVAGSLSEVQRPTGSSTAIAKFCSTDGRGLDHVRQCRRWSTIDRQIPQH
jgi:hypothetical protein